MTQGKARGTCKCWKQVNHKLKEFNTKLTYTFGMFSGIVYLNIETEKIDKKSRKPLKRIICSHCPFCGRNLENDAQ